MKQAEIDLFINRAQQKIADLAAGIVNDINEANDYSEELELSKDLYTFIDSLTDTNNDWSDFFIQRTVEYYNKRADLNLYPWDSFLGYSSYLGEGGSGSAGDDGRGIDTVAIVDGDLIITYSDGSTQNAGPVGAGGANIFVIDVQPVNAGKSVNLFYETNTIGQNIIDYVETDDTELDIYIWWDGGKEWNGTIVAEGTTIFPNTQRISNNSRCFLANAVVDVTGLTEVHIEGNGGETILPIVALPALPTVIDASFGTYPVTRSITQTELKDGDTINFILTLSSSSNINSIVLSGSSGWDDGEYLVTQLGNNQVRATLTSNHNFLVDTARGVVLRLKTNTGSLSDPYDSTGIAEANLNNLAPIITFNSITYPASQEALKNSESATVDITVANQDEILYSSPGSQLSIPSTATYTQTKSASRISGDYNISTGNYKIDAYRNSNGSSATYTCVVQIAHQAANIIVTTPAARLISGGNDGTTEQDHSILVTSTQKLIELPDLGADIGTLQGDMVNINSPHMTQFNETLRVADADKGDGTWTISATNLAGVETTTMSVSSYVVGGFIRRRKYFAAFTNEVQMGVDVVNVNKLNAWDKDLISMTYTGSTANYVRGYTIINDDTIHWNDSAEVANNTTGLSFIEIEEIP